MSASSEGWLSLRFDATLLPAGCAAAPTCANDALPLCRLLAVQLPTHACGGMPPARSQLLAVELEPDNPRDANAVLVLHSERCGSVTAGVDLSHDSVCAAASLMPDDSAMVCCWARVVVVLTLNALLPSAAAGWRWATCRTWSPATWRRCCGPCRCVHSLPCVWCCFHWHHLTRCAAALAVNRCASSPNPGCVWQPYR